MLRPLCLFLALALATSYPLESDPNNNVEVEQVQKTEVSELKEGGSDLPMINSDPNNNVEVEQVQNAEVSELEEGGSDLPMINAGFFGGDMAGFDPDEFHSRNAIVNKNLRWPRGVVPYVIDYSLNGMANLIRSAMDHYHQTTCIRFKPRTNERDYIYLKADQGCWSYVGRQGGRQIISLGRGCGYKGTIIHELAHAIGFWHEQNRPDRNNAIIIYWNNIQRGQEHNFRLFGYNDVDLLGERYDLNSVMQYGEYAFAKDRYSPTIKARSGATILDAWQKKGFSASDIRRVKKLYCQ